VPSAPPALLSVLIELPDVSDMLRAVLAGPENRRGCEGILERAESLTCLSFVHCLYSSRTAFAHRRGSKRGRKGTLGQKVKTDHH
jgi:hypothetical protein